MLNRERLKELDEASSLLVAQADVYRNLLRVEAAAVQQRLDSLTRIGQKFSPVTPLILAAGTVVGFLLMRRRRSSIFRWVPTLLSIWRWGRLILGWTLGSGALKR